MATINSTKVTKAEQLAERAKRTEAKASEAQARAEAERAKAEKLAAAAEAEAAKQAEREIAEAAKQAEADRVADHLMNGWGALCRLMTAEGEGLIAAVGEAWVLGHNLAEAGVSARKAAIHFMGEANWAEKKANAKAEGKAQVQPEYLSKCNDAVNLVGQYPDYDQALQAARDWLATDPASVSLRSFVKGENVNKAKRKGDPMTAKAAAGLFAKACEREGLSEDQAWALISEALENVAE